MTEIILTETKKFGENIVEVNDMLYRFLNFDGGEKKFDISTLTKKGARLIQLRVYETVSFEGEYPVPTGTYDITFPFLNGRLPNNFSITSGQCDITIQELAGVGDKKYFKIKKENDNGIPSYNS